MEGYVYVLSNSAYPGLLKIGKTHREPEIRVKELSSATGVPKPFKIEFYVHTPDCDSLELKTHRYFMKYRYVKNREFFNVSLEEVEVFLKKYGTIRNPVILPRVFEKIGKGYLFLFKWLMIIAFYSYFWPLILLYKSYNNDIIESSRSRKIFFFKLLIFLYVVIFIIMMILVNTGVI